MHCCAYRDKNVSFAVHSFANAIGKRPVQFYDLDVIVELGIDLGSNRGNILKEFVSKELFGPFEIENSETIVSNNGKLSINVSVSPE